MGQAQFSIYSGVHGERQLPRLFRDFVWRNHRANVLKHIAADATCKLYKEVARLYMEQPAPAVWSLRCQLWSPCV